MSAEPVGSSPALEGDESEAPTPGGGLDALDEHERAMLVSDEPIPEPFDPPPVVDPLPEEPRAFLFRFRATAEYLPVVFDVRGVETTEAGIILDVTDVRYGDGTIEAERAVFWSAGCSDTFAPEPDTTVLAWALRRHVETLEAGGVLVLAAGVPGRGAGGTRLVHDGMVEFPWGPEPVDAILWAEEGAR